jgi:uncharacterized protein
VRCGAQVLRCGAQVLRCGAQVLHGPGCPETEIDVKRMWTAFGLMMALGGSGVAAQGQGGVQLEPVVVVAGEGIVKAPPDQAWVTLATESRSKNPKDAQSQNAAAMNAVQQKLAAAGLSKDLVRTLAYDLQLESDWVNGRQVPRGYVARNIIEVRLDDIGRVGEVIDLAVTSGANSVQGVRFDLKQRDTLEREALKRASADARARADAAAAGAGSSLGRVLRIEEPVVRSYPMAAPPVAMMREAAADSRAPTPFVAGEIEIRATVTMTVQLKN